MTMEATETEAIGVGQARSKCTSSSRVADDGTLTVCSKRSERRRKKQQLKQPRALTSNLRLLDLPFDILIHILCLLRPSDNFRLARSCRSLHIFVLCEHPARIATVLIRWRYPCLEQCLRLPVPLAHIPPEDHEALLDEERLVEWERDMRRRTPYQHIKALDPRAVCRCLTCALRWNVLCLAVDFAHWQAVLDHPPEGKSPPIPVIPRGRQPEWNRQLLDTHAAVVGKALASSSPAQKLWHAVILEAHLNSTVRSIRRHRANRFNKRPHFLMTEHDAAKGTDAFLQAKGPPSVDFPFARDNYYMLEAYLPNRSWFKEREQWGYLPADQHDKDLEQMRKWAAWRRDNKEKTRWLMEFRASEWRPTLVINGGAVGKRTDEDKKKNEEGEGE